MEIPHTVDVRPDTGLYNGKLGMWLFLASEVMLFGALFSTYIYIRTAAPSWPLPVPPDTEPVHLDVLPAMINTLVLIISSVTMVWCWASLKMGQFRDFQLHLILTLVCAVAFLCIKAYEYGGKFGHHHYPSTNNFLGLYFTLTGLHGLHVIAGMAVLIYFLVWGKKMWHTEPERFTNRIETTGLYWHFVDLVWIFLFPVFYLL
ncbi:MAG: cytochrome c oxidase subunit 3 [Planctomycetota bacterium]|nr:cytochrome c oxidase subunit 3 [Planctomycetota bacterium]